MDWPTVLASAGVSAVIGAVVSLLTVSQTTVRRARAERREQARLAVRAVVEPMLSDLARYTYAAGRRTTPRRDDDTAHMDDHTRVVAVRTAASGLPAWRRWLIDRRLRRIFGNYWCDLARDYPTARQDGEGTFAAWLASSVRPDEADQNDSRTSLMHRAYATPPGNHTQAHLRRELRKLAAAR